MLTIPAGAPLGPQGVRRGARDDPEAAGGTAELVDGPAGGDVGEGSSCLCL